MSRESWHVPERREPGVLYMHGHPGTDYAAVRAIEVDGQRFERVKTCENVNTDGYGFRFKCSECGYSTIVHNCAVRLDELPRFCPNCGCEVMDA